ncbi:hypothetical protein Cfla_3266 [Cellulomonas flavigena DSM 20109]|uniref:LigA n=1 Tax=Cellulomonas flavigena (strain ATCC 482 / DSM 20109 / BCRC 11376 / JCM 18109 / NBRC 3775 / NCIMB 8073 / NRS 134) TaxID=446466 RepID=D5UBY8_CELFN|nr:sporulation delaying protein family toxin [Cellulomonas flavigena]ADG76147.1 hypothetical protein Cfla_3266 [Cellulomonas flavigena DSM 20109]
MRKKVLVSVLVVALSVAGARSAEAASTPAPADVVEAFAGASDADYGREAFRAMAFGQGELGSELVDAGFFGAPEQAAELVAANNSEPVLAVTEDLLDQVDEADPALFERFGESARSGDPYLLRDALVDAGDALEQAAAESGAQTEVAGAQPDAAALVVVVAVLIALAVFGGAAVTVLYVANGAAAVNVSYVKNRSVHSKELKAEEQLAIATVALDAR